MLHQASQPLLILIRHSKPDRRSRHALIVLRLHFRMQSLVLKRPPGRSGIRRSRGAQVAGVPLPVRMRPLSGSPRTAGRDVGELLAATSGQNVAAV
jgi:hypothetical protein